MRWAWWRRVWGVIRCCLSAVLDLCYPPDANRGVRSANGDFPYDKKLAKGDEMKRLPTDREILNAIYDRYYQVFAQYTDGDDSRSTKIYVPIDVGQIAGDLKDDVHIIFGRLYYHLEKKYGYRQDDDTIVHLFSLKVGEDTHCVNFPLAAAVLADLRHQAKKYNMATWIAAGSLAISLISIAISIIGQQ